MIEIGSAMRMRLVLLLRALLALRSMAMLSATATPRRPGSGRHGRGTVEFVESTPSQATVDPTRVEGGAPAGGEEDGGAIATGQR